MPCSRTAEGEAHRNQRHRQQRSPPTRVHCKVSGEASSKEKKEHWRSGSGWQGGVGAASPTASCRVAHAYRLLPKALKRAGAGRGRGKKGRWDRGECTSICEFFIGSNRTYS